MIDLAIVEKLPDVKCSDLPEGHDIAVVFLRAHPKYPSRSQLIKVIVRGTWAGVFGGERYWWMEIAGKRGKFIVDGNTIVKDLGINEWFLKSEAIGRGVRAAAKSYKPQTPDSDDD